MEMVTAKCKVSGKDEAEIRSIIHDSLEAWNIMADMLTRILALDCKDPNVKAAADHAMNAFSQEINGCRDHLKDILGET